MKKTSNFQEVLGMDTDTSYRAPMDYFISSSVAELSIAGQTVTSGNMQLNIRDNALFDIRRTSIAFQLTVSGGNAVFENALQMFQPITCQIGGVQWSMSDGAVLLQQLLHTTPKDELWCAKGMLLETREPDLFYMPEDNESSVIQEKALYVKNSGVEVGNPLTVLQGSKYGALYQRQSGVGQYKVVIPICKIWPWLEHSFPSGFIHLSMGQALIANAQINAPSLYANSPTTGFGTPVFTITNAQLIKVMSPLSPELVSDVLRSTIPFRRVDWLLVKQPLSPSCVFNYNLSEKQRVRRIIFSCNWALPAVYAGATGNSAIAANSYGVAFDQDKTEGNLISSYKATLSYFPDVWAALSLVQISFGGQTITLSAQLLQSLGDGKESLFQQCYLFDNLVERQIRSVFTLDLSRFGMDDLIGSSSGNQLACQVQLIFNTTEQSGFIVPGLTGDKLFAAGVPARFQIYSFIETSSSCSIENGIYKNE